MGNKSKVVAEYKMEEVCDVFGCYNKNTVFPSVLCGPKGEKGEGSCTTKILIIKLNERIFLPLHIFDYQGIYRLTSYKKLDLNLDKKTELELIFPFRGTYHGILYINNNLYPLPQKITIDPMTITEITLDLTFIPEDTKIEVEKPIYQEPYLVIKTNTIPKSSLVYLDGQIHPSNIDGENINIECNGEFKKIILLLDHQLIEIQD